MSTADFDTALKNEYKRFRLAIKNSAAFSWDTHPLEIYNMYSDKSIQNFIIPIVRWINIPEFSLNINFHESMTTTADITVCSIVYLMTQYCTPCLIHMVQYYLWLLKHTPLKIKNEQVKKFYETYFSCKSKLYYYV